MLPTDNRPCAFWIFFSFRFVDESPRWLFSQGRYQEAGTIIRKMLIQNGKADLIPEQGFTVAQLRQALSTSAVKEPVGATSVEQEDGEQQQQQQQLATVADCSTDDVDRKYGIVDLFKWPRLRSRTLNVSLNW